MRLSLRPDVRALPQTLLIGSAWLLALALAGWTAAWWYWRAQAPEAQSAQAESLSDTVTAAQNVASRQLFGAIAQPKLASAGPQSNLVVVGVQTRWGKLPGFAVISDGAGPAKSVVEGENISEGVKLVKVLADGIQIERNGLTEEIRLTSTARPGGLVQQPVMAPPPQASAAAGDN